MNASLQTGTFVKTASPHVIEVLGTTGLDFVVVDAEHAPFDRATLDLMVLAGRAARIPVFVRIPEIHAATVLSCLDLGAAGLLVPHVDSVQQAREVVAMARYPGGGGGVRGYSGGPRAGGYASLPMQDILERGDATPIVCQIESPHAVAAAEAIAATEGVAGLFVGRADLALAMGLTDAKAPEVLAATRQVLQAARAAGKWAGMHVASSAERAHFMEQGADWFVVSSDQGLLRSAAQALAQASAQPGH